MDGDAHKPAPTFHSVWLDVAEWSIPTFGSSAERGPVGPLKHMVKELTNELLPPLGEPTKLDEYADLLILLCDAARRAGHCSMDVLDAAVVKMQINRSRKWPKPVDGQACEHIK